ncbi:MAG: hypothetical protein KatS3mg005_4134 [Bryobacteraceae bacterium]|nr:MAG: hypothetical protein KatS3mg005_4134 [Bryobacteraceae bacterium]
MALPPSVRKAAERGWSLIPVREDKRPALKSWSEFQKHPATLEQLEQWARMPQVTAWAVVTGQVSRLVILDFDGEQGLATLKRLNLAPHLRTGSGGAHVYFQHPGWRVPTLNSKTSKKLRAEWPGLDIRADGGYAVFWGRNKSGAYRWQRKAELEPLDKLPSALRQLLSLWNPPAAPKAAATPEASTGELSVRLLDMALARARSDGRNNAGFWYACQLRDNGVPEQLARGLMERYAASVPSTNTKGQAERYTVQEALASLAEAYAAPARAPLKPPRPRRRLAPATPPQKQAEAPAAEDAEPPYLRAAGNYRLREDGLYYVRNGRDGGRAFVQLTNFPAVITADIERDDGATRSRAFKIYAKVQGQPKEIVIGTKEFPAMDWTLEYLGSNAIVYPNLKDHTRTAMQELSREKSFQYVYQHTGWTVLGDVHVYLHAGGAIGARGSVPGLMIDLDPQLARFRLPEPPSGDSLRHAVRASLWMLDVMPDRITFPLFAAIWRVPLGPVDVALHIAGRSGTGKSELAALAQQHFGAEFTRKNLPGSWDSTMNSLQALAFYAKDALLVVDDFVPRGSTSDIQRLHRDADRLIRSQGNQQGRGRMNADGSLRTPMWPRGLIVSTGEDIPRGASCRARMIVLEADPTDMHWELLTRCQADAQAGLYAAAMAGFLAWTAPQMPEMPQRLMDALIRFRETWAKIQAHARTPDNLANLHFGFSQWLRFALEIQAVTPEEASILEKRAAAALAEIAEAQITIQEHVDPVRQFLDLVVAALTSGRAHLCSMRGDCPETMPARWGWIQVGADWKPQGAKIGWVDEEFVYLQWKAAYAAAQQVGRDIGEQIAVTVNTLGKRLKQAGLLAAVDQAREVNYVRKWIEGASQNVWQISPEGVYAQK